MKMTFSKGSIPFFVLLAGCAAASPPAEPPVLPRGPQMAAPEAPPPASPPSVSPQCQPDATIDAAARLQVIQKALSAIRDEYVFPDVAAKMEAAVRARQKKGEYDKLTTASALSTALTAHLQAVSQDKHLHVECFAGVVPPDEDEEKPADPAERERRLKFERRVNHGFEKVERLPGNIGYLEMRGFTDPATGGDTAAAAMTFVADADALIIDLRRNGGGEASMVAFVSSYLFESKPVHLNDLVWRKDNRVEQFWTLPHVPGRRFGRDKPVYVLTSSDTFSAAEEFTYNLKNLKRATIVGETTGGGAHPGGFRRLSDHFAIWVPRGRARNPISQTNWEGKGVKPDVETKPANALKMAHLLALKARVDKVEEPRVKEEVQSLIRKLEAELSASK
jgi:hypothetical protein